MALTTPNWLILQALAGGVSPTTGLPVTADDLKNEDVALALREGAAAIVAANQPKVTAAPAKKSKIVRKPRTPKVVAPVEGAATNGSAGAQMPASGVTASLNV